MVKRLFDLFFSAFGLMLLSPLFIILAIMIVKDSAGGVFYFQMRVGKNNKDFRLFKFRSMRPNSDQKGLLTLGNNDLRVTRIGQFVRKYKLDELPQLFNVLLGDMSLVGPRPEVRKYVNYYNAQQQQVLLVKPGITDYASITFSDENELLANAEDPEQFYIQNILPQKLELNLQYIREQSLLIDLRIIFRTLQKIF